MPGEAVEIHYSADMRYLDQIYEVTAPLPDPALPDLDFLFPANGEFPPAIPGSLLLQPAGPGGPPGYVVRVAAVGRLPRVAQLDRRDTHVAAVPTGTRQVYFGEWREAPTYTTDSLPTGMEITRPGHPRVRLHNDPGAARRLRHRGRHGWHCVAGEPGDSALHAGRGVW